MDSILFISKINCFYFKESVESSSQSSQKTANNKSLANNSLSMFVEHSFDSLTQIGFEVYLSIVSNGSLHSLKPEIRNKLNYGKI